MPSAEGVPTPEIPSLSRGVFTLSLDFELIWGTLDLFGPGRFDRPCRVERDQVIDGLLGLLEEYEVAATWYVLGHVLLPSCRRVNGVAHPEIVRPRHSWVGGDWFGHDPCGDEDSHPTFYGRRLVEKILACRVTQEIGSHSFSHVIFGDRGCSLETAASEIQASLEAASELGLKPRSFAFPRNRAGHLDLVRDLGFSSYRGPGPRWYENRERAGPVSRLAHLLDFVLATPPPLVLPARTPEGLVNLPGSMVFFPMHGARRALPLSRRVRRAVKGLEAAARERKVFHLWFHPTNLADHPETMLGGLRQIFGRVADLRRRGLLRVAPVGEVCALSRPELP
jgi:peptidoglycan/xylan/chitin deacetylase (PgdA/CDA1 family)